MIYGKTNWYFPAYSGSFDTCGEFSCWLGGQKQHEVFGPRAGRVRCRCAPLFYKEREQILVFLRGDELIALAVDIDYLYLVVVLQVLAQLGDIDIH